MKNASEGSNPSVAAMPWEVPTAFFLAKNTGCVLTIFLYNENKDRDGVRSIADDDKERMSVMMDRIASLDQVSNKNPVFLQVDLYETPKEYRDEYEMPYATATVAAMRSYDDGGDKMVTMAVLKPAEQLHEAAFRRAPQTGDYLSCLTSEMDLKELQPTADLQDAYQAFQKMHKEAPYQVTGSLYEETPVYMSYDVRKEFPRFPEIKDTEKTWDLADARLRDGSAVDSLGAAEKWMLENHPAYVQGMTITQKCPSGNFMMSAVPCAEYPQGQYETFEGRMNYAQARAAELGVELGSERVKDILPAYEQKAERRMPLMPAEQREQQSEFELG